MRIALVINLAPRKLGSLEDWIVGIAVEAHRRGHTLDVFGRRPIHREVERRLAEAGSAFSTTDELEAAPVAGVRRLAGYDVLYLNMFQPRTGPALLCYAAWPAKVILVDHTSGREPPPVMPLRAALSRAVDKLSLARVDALVGVSEYVRQRDVERFGLEPSRTRTIYNGVDLERFRVRPRGPTDGRPRITAVAHLTHEKGVDVLLKAFARARTQAELTIAGDGPLAEEFKRLSASLGLGERARFIGLRDDVDELLARTDVFVHPARWQEAFGLTIAEGMASGCAVIASRTGGIPEIIEHGRSGVLVTPEDEFGLAGALEALAASPDDRQRLGRAARRRVEEHFALSRCVGEHLDYMEEVAFDMRPTLPAMQRVPTAHKNVVIGDRLELPVPPPEALADDADARGDSAVASRDEATLELPKA